MNFQLNWGVHTSLKLLRDESFCSMLDIGAGSGEHKRLFESFGKKVTAVDLRPPADYLGDFLDLPIQGEYDAIWCCHVLEHQRNPGLFLDKIYQLLKPAGILALCVPKHPPERIVSGHLSAWSLPLVCHHLIHAGFDCRSISAFSTYEIGVIVKKDGKGLLPSSICKSYGEIKEFFPDNFQLGCEIKDGIINWGDPLEYPLPRLATIDRIEILSKNLDLYPILRPAITFLDQ